MKLQTSNPLFGKVRPAKAIPAVLVPLITLILFSILIYACESAVDNSHPRATITREFDSIAYGGNNSVRIDDTTFVDYSKTWMVVIQFEYKSTNPVSIEYWARNMNGGPDVYRKTTGLGASGTFVPVSDTIYPQQNCTSNIFSTTYTLQSPGFEGSSTVIREFNLYRYQ